jgi:5-hydroxyisourate hydrolase-like protein (transthyretin family)
MTPRFRTEFDGRIDDSPTINGRSRAAGLYRLDLECTTRASVFDSLNLIKLFVIHCFVSPTQAVMEEKARFWSM